MRLILHVVQGARLAWSFFSSQVVPPFRIQRCAGWHLYVIPVSRCFLGCEFRCIAEANTDRWIRSSSTGALYFHQAGHRASRTQCPPLLLIPRLRPHITALSTFLYQAYNSFWACASKLKWHSFECPFIQGAFRDFKGRHGSSNLSNSRLVLFLDTHCSSVA